MNSTEIGAIGESLVLEKYESDGYTLVARNFNYYQSEKIGEIDLILEKNRRLYLVEVKTRNNSTLRIILEQITRKKLSCIYTSFQGFVKKYPMYATYFVQLDVAAVVDDQILIYPNCYSFESLMQR